MPPEAPLGLCPRCVMTASLAPLERPSEAELAEAELPEPSSAHRASTADFGEYELLEEIGRGGMGIVYKARHRSLRRMIALKMVLPSRLTSVADLRRFQIEAQAAGRLDHPHILPIYEVGEVSGQPYYTMKWAEGGSLAHTERRRPPPGAPRGTAPAAATSTQAAWAALVLKIARAVAYAHERGVLHRDLKPGNILLDQRGEPYVADFGLAKLLEQETGLSQSLPTVGTPSYAAPEQLQGAASQVSVAADVYSLGAILYELLTDKPPFAGPTPIETIRQAVDAPAQPPHLLNPSVDRYLETICLKCLEKESKRRYPTAAALAEDLERWLARKPIQARPVGGIERTWLWCRRKPALAALAGALAFTIVLGSAAAAWSIGIARQEQRREAYHASVAQAHSLIKDGSTDRAMELLLRCPEEFRHWEWGYLVAQCHQELLTLPAHRDMVMKQHFESRIRNLAFDATGDRLVTCGVDGHIQVWDARTGQRLPGLSNLLAAGWAVSPAAPELAVGLTNGPIRRFDLGQGRELATLEFSRAAEIGGRAAGQDDGTVISLAYAPDGESLAAAASSGTVWLWDPASGRLLWRTQTSVRSPSVFFRTDGKEIIVQGQLAACWLERDSAVVRQFRQLDPLRFWSLHVSPDGATQVTIGAAGELEFWPPDGEPRSLGRIVTADSALPRRASFSPDGRAFCTTGAGGTARVFSVPTAEMIVSIQDPVFAPVFSPDGGRLVAVVADRKVDVYDLGRRARAMTLRGHLMIVDCAAFSPDGRRIATADRDGYVKVWSGSPGRSSLLLGEWPRLIRVAPDGRTIAASAYYDRVNVWDLESGTLLQRRRARYDKTYNSDLSPDGLRLATVALDSVLRIWNATNGSLIDAFQASRTNALRAVHFTPDGRSLATCDTAGVVKLWDVASRSERLSLDTHGLNIWDIEFDRTSRHAVLAALNRPPLVWNLQSGRVEQVLADANGAWSSRFSPDGKTLVLAGLDGLLRSYETASWSLKESHKCRGRGTGWMDFTADGRRLALPVADGGTFGQDAGSIQIWDAERGRELIAIGGPADAFYGNWFTANHPPRLVTANGDRMIYQFEAFPWRTADYAGRRGDFAQRIRSYAADYWRRRLAREEAARAAGAGVDGSAAVDDLCLPPRSPQCEPRMIDLGSHYNVRLDGWLHPTVRDELSDFSLSAFPSGMVMLLGVPFDARGVALTRRFEPKSGVLRNVWERVPSRIEGIPVHRRARRLHVLQATCPDDVAPDGAVVGSYVWHFADGTTWEQAITYGQDLRSWWWMPSVERPVDLERGRLAWTGDTPRAAESGARIRLYLTTYPNPHPELEVSHIDLVSKVAYAAPFLVAMTVEP